MTEEKGAQETEEKEVTESFWDKTRHTLNSAAHRATQYKRIVQKKIDLASTYKKINTLYADLGKYVYGANKAGKKELFEDAEVIELLDKLDVIKRDAAVLEAEIEAIRTEAEEQETD